MGDSFAESIAEMRTLPELGRILRELRRRDARQRRTREVTYRELAAKTGWSHAVIGGYFTGRTLPPTNRFDVLLSLLGARPAERGLLATARDRVEELQRALSSRVVTGGVRLGGASIVGRRPELAGLRAAVNAASRGSGSAVFLIGEAGIGKTRLAQEVARFAAGAGMRVLRGRAARPAIQFRALSEAILSALRRSGMPDNPDLLAYRPALARLVPEWRRDHQVTTDDSLVVLAEAVLRLAASLGPGGCLLSLEDLHDADQDTLAIVDYLVDNVVGEPVLVLATARTAPSAGLDMVRAAVRRRVASAYDIASLDDDEVRHLAALCLDVAPDHVPGAVLDWLHASADGVPLHVEELLAGMVGDGVLARTQGRWTVTEPVVEQVPVSLVTTLTSRVDRLGVDARALLESAALLGRSGSTNIAGAAAGVEGGDLVSCLRDVVEQQLLVLDGDDYSFRHALMAEALRAGMLPSQRASLSRRLASLLSDMNGQLAGELWYAAGENRRAAELFGLAGRQAAAQGGLSTAISLLERSLSIVDGHPVEVVEALVGAYANAGRITDAYELGARLSGQPVAHLRLAQVAASAGHWEQGLRELTTVRNLLDLSTDMAMAARVDAIGARLVFGTPSPDRVSAARELAGRALHAAVGSGQPDVACDALDVLGRCARLQDMAEADAIYERGLSIAEEHNLVHRRVRLLFDIGAHDGIRHAEPGRLVEALSLANQIGAVETALDIELELCVVRICRGELPVAGQSARRCEEVATRLRLAHTRLIALGIRIIVAAHLGRRFDVDGLLVRYRELGGEDDDLAPAVHGFGVAFCMLLEEQREQALAELRRAAADESVRPASYVSFVPGPHLLLTVLAGLAGQEECDVFAQSISAQAGWNRQFMVLAQAVIHGRAGRGAEASNTMVEFHALSRRYPLAHHLGLRLAAEVALEHGWGDPVTWLRTAEIHFHESAAPVARACREMLRRAGASVHQHRHGSDTVPRQLRERGVTVREFEVLRLVADGLNNRDIGQRLFLSPRTVEKHVARLLAKTGQRDRSLLADFAVAFLPMPEDG